MHTCFNNKLVQKPKLIIKNFSLCYFLFWSQVSGDTNQTGSRGETIRRSPGGKAASDFQVSTISHSDDLSSQSMSSLPQVESNPRFIEDESYMRGTTSVRRDFKPGTLRDDKTNTINENMNVLMNENNY